MKAVGSRRRNQGKSLEAVARWVNNERGGTVCQLPQSSPPKTKTKKESQTVKRIREKDIDDVIEDVINHEAEARQQGEMTSSTTK